MKIYLKTDLAYMAGLLDGEGHIGIALRKNLISGHILRIEISNTNKAMIDWILPRFDGHGVIRKDRWGEGNRKDSYVWYADNRKAVRLLKMLIPYLVLKKEQAEIAVYFQSSIPAQGRGPRITKDVFEFRESLRLKMRILNKRGRNA
jgi:hypothetical protein